MRGISLLSRSPDCSQKCHDISFIMEKHIRLMFFFLRLSFKSQTIEIVHVSEMDIKRFMLLGQFAPTITNVKLEFIMKYNNRVEYIFLN